MFAMPVMAQQTLSPMEVESIPFSNNAPTLNTQSVTQTIDMSTEVEHIASAEGKKAGLPQFDTTTFSSQIFWLIITFVILYLYFSNTALPKLSSAIEKRREIIASDLKQADITSADVDKTRTDYEAAMQQAQMDSRSIIIDAEAHLRAQADAQSNEFKDKSAKAVQDLEQQAAKAKDKIKNDLSAIAADIANDIIGKITSLDVNDADIDKAIKNSMGEALPSTTKRMAA